MNFFLNRIRLKWVKLKLKKILKNFMKICNKHLEILKIKLTMSCHNGQRVTTTKKNPYSKANNFYLLSIHEENIFVNPMINRSFNNREKYC